MEGSTPPAAPIVNTVAAVRIAAEVRLRVLSRVVAPVVLASRVV